MGEGSSDLSSKQHVHVATWEHVLFDKVQMKAEAVEGQGV